MQMRAVSGGAAQPPIEGGHVSGPSDAGADEDEDEDEDEVEVDDSVDDSVIETLSAILERTTVEPSSPKAAARVAAALAVERASSSPRSSRPIADGLARAPASAALEDSVLVGEIWGVGQKSSAFLLEAHGVSCVGELRNLYSGLCSDDAVLRDLRAIVPDQASSVREVGPLSLVRAAAFVRARLRLDDVFAVSVVAAMSRISEPGQLLAALDGAPVYYPPRTA
jgi:hypothetical protein